MGSYFKPLRRKLGVVTLVMACVFAAGWVRSLVTTDLIYLPLPNVRFVLVSGGQQLAYVMGNEQQDVRVSAHPEINNTTSVIFKMIEKIEEVDIPFHWTSWKLSRVIFREKDGKRIQPLATTPYWYIASPLTLLSAYLLLSKPGVTRSNTMPMEVS